MEIKKIAFIPGAFRPFGNHHMKMVKHFSDMCDLVVVVVSNPKNDENKRLTSNGYDISANDAKKIIDLCLNDCEIENVKTKISYDDSPINTILNDISNLKDCKVVLGVSDKNGDENRFDWINTEKFKRNNVEILPPKETAFHEVEDDDGVSVSATDIRSHIDDKEMLATYLPPFIEEETFGKIYDILNRKEENSVEINEESKPGLKIFQDLIDESVEFNSDDDSLDMIDEEDLGFSGIDLSDDSLDSSKKQIMAYNSKDFRNGNPYTIEDNPDKAFDILIKLDSGDEVEIYLDPVLCEWDSRVNGKSKLTPDQMFQFFKTDFCHKINDRLFQLWPSGDPRFNRLLNCVKNKKVNVDPIGIMTEDGEFRKGNIDILRSRGKNAAGEQIYTNSGRKIVSFSDFGVKHTEDEAYFVYPELGKEWKWSQWQDWKKAKLCCRCRFQHNSYLYGLSLSFFEEDNDNRGFRSYNLDLDPKLQYCTPIETTEILDLTLVKKFLRVAIKRLNSVVKLSDNEIFNRIGRPDKCTLDDVRKTKHVVKNTMKAIRERRADTYIYTD